MKTGNGDTLTKRAYAKINLGLDVLRKREDGYHEVRMIMQTVSLYDTLVFTKMEKGITVVTNHEKLPGDESNLVYKAAKLLADTYGIEEGIKIELEKRIPMAAGMAGGSTDAAAVFRGMNEMYGLGMTGDEMRALAVKIGADVPYCIRGGTALSEGIGEALTELPDIPDCFLLIAKPDIDVSTRYVYENLHADRLTYHPDIDGMRRAIEEGDFDGIVQRMENVLETVTIKKYPVIQEIKEYMKEKGAVHALMSGSGPSAFGVFRTKEAAERALRSLKTEKEGLAGQLFVAAPVSRAEVE